MATSALPDQQQQQQQQAAIYQQSISNGNYRHSGSVGPFFAVIAVITVLAALSCVVGQVFSRRLEGLDGSRYDCLEWMRWPRRWRYRAGDVENGRKAVRNVEAADKPQDNEQPPPTST